MSRTQSPITPPPPAVELCVRDVGRMPYAEAYAVQKQSHQEVLDLRGAGRARCFLLLVEHDPPVITISRRPGARNHLIASERQLRDAGVEVAETDRGGDITYHGPGQLVVYPILDLNAMGLRLNSYLRFLEQVVIDTLGEFNIEAMRDPAATGVWVAPKAEGRRGDPCLGVPAKIAAIGVRVSRWVTMHGLALNVSTNLDHFDLIVPCGLAGRSVTSMQRELGSNTPDMDNVKDAIVRRFREAVNNR